MFRVKRARIIIVIFLFCMIAYFTNDFQLINIEKTAIIVALGIDKSNEELEITTQIAVPQASNQNVSNSDAVLSAKDKTLYGALEKISLETGWYPKLTFCNLIIIDKELLNGDFMPIIDYILTSERFQNSAVIAASENKAKEVLTSATPLDFISSFALQKILLRNLDRSSSSIVSDVRTFTALSRSHSQFCYMPLIKSIQTQDKPQGDSGQSGGSQSGGSQGNANQIVPTASGDGSGSSGGGSNSSGSSQNSSSTVFDASSTVMFSKGKTACLLNSDLTHCYNLITKRVKEAFISVETNNGQTKTQTLVSIVTNRPKIKLDFTNSIPTVKITLELICEKEESNANQNIHSLSNPKTLSKEELSAIEDKLKKSITELVELSVNSDCDFLQLKELTYRNNGKYYYLYKDNLLRVINSEITVKCKNRK